MSTISEDDQEEIISGDSTDNLLAPSALASASPQTRLRSSLKRLLRISASREPATRKEDIPGSNPSRDVLFRSGSSAIPESNQESHVVTPDTQQAASACASAYRTALGSVTEAFKEVHTMTQTFTMALDASLGGLALDNLGEKRFNCKSFRIVPSSERKEDTVIQLILPSIGSKTGASWLGQVDDRSKDHPEQVFTQQDLQDRLSYHCERGHLDQMIEIDRVAKYVQGVARRGSVKASTGLSGPASKTGSSLVGLH